MSGSSPKTNKKLKFVDPAEFTPHFAWRKQPASSEKVFAEEVSLEAAAEKFGTPLYLYSKTSISSSFRELDRGLQSVPHTICFAVKSNGNLSILQHLARQGSGFDVVSGGELIHLRHLGVPGNRIVFSGVGKSREEIREGLKYSTDRKSLSGILLFNVESEPELEVLLEESARHIARGGRPPAVAIRVNPDVKAGGHPKIATGYHDHKFGLDLASAATLYKKFAISPFISWQGVSSHIGSQITSLKPFERALQRLALFVTQLRRQGIALKYLDFGGGLGVRYTDQVPPSRADYAKMVTRIVKPLGVHLLLEPGRNIIAPAGVLLTRVLYVKKTRTKNFVVVDAAMNDLMRPSLYGAVHSITKVVRCKSDSTSLRPVDVVGPVCETGDCFLHDWPLQEVKSGDLMAIWTAGAYGMSLSSNYNARARAAEVLVDGKKMQLIRRRETVRDLLRGDVLA